MEFFVEKGKIGRGLAAFVGALRCRPEQGLFRQADQTFRQRQPLNAKNFALAR